MVSSGWAYVPDTQPYFSLEASIVNDLVDVVCGHARLCSRSGDVKDFPGQSAHLAHACDSLLVQDLDIVLAYIRISWNAIFRPFRVRYRLGNDSLG
jgi:hypothetical protein